jgi:hypothetical protein
MVINEREAGIVRYMFETYATQQIGLDKIAQQLENAGTLTKKGNTVWRRSAPDDARGPATPVSCLAVVPCSTNASAPFCWRFECQ